MSDPKPATPATKEPDVYTLKSELNIPQRDGTHITLPEGHTMPVADARRLAKAGVLDFDKGKQAEPK